MGHKFDSQMSEGGDQEIDQMPQICRRHPTPKQVISLYQNQTAD